MSLKLMQALELGLDLPSGRLVNHFVPDAADIIQNLYHEASSKKFINPHLKRIWPHSDLGIITLVFQDSVGGLEFEDREHPGQFIPLEPTSSDDLIVNVSDTLERWTNGVIQAGVHRVNVPAPLLSKSTISGDSATEDVVPERRSIVMLYRAKGETSVGPLPEFVTPKRPAKFDEMNAADYLALKNNLTFGNVEASVYGQKESSSEGATRATAVKA